MGDGLGHPKTSGTCPALVTRSQLEQIVQVVALVGLELLSDLGHLIRLVCDDGIDRFLQVFTDFLVIINGPDIDGLALVVGLVSQVVLIGEVLDDEEVYLIVAKAP